MTPFVRLSGIAAGLPLANVDTDKILPGAYLKTVTRRGLGAALFDPLRRDEAGNERPEFVLNQAPWDRAVALVTLQNFGCGSSREHAPWALVDFGIRAIIAPSFADIFRENCIKNGLLPAVVAPDAARKLIELVSDKSTASLTVDLSALTITDVRGAVTGFVIDEGDRAALMSGLDEIDRSIACLDVIERHLASRVERNPWIRQIPLSPVQSPDL